jgi:hypothetical protein
MEELLQKGRRNNNGMSFPRDKQNRLIKPRTFVLSSPYLINIFLVGCSPAVPIYAFVDESKSKLILGLNYNCKFVSG